MSDLLRLAGVMGLGPRHDDGREVLYRGTRRIEVQGQQKVPSWTPCLECALIWSSSPRTVLLERDSTVHAAQLPHGTTVLDVTSWGITWNLRDVLEKLGSTDAFVDDVKKLLWGLHKRRMGRTKLSPEFRMVVLDEDGSMLDDNEVVTDFSILDPDTVPRAFCRDFFEYDPTMETASRFMADSFAFADSPTVQRLLTSRGYGAVRYLDAFEGARFATKKLFGVGPDELDGVHVADDIDLEEAFAHVTVRPFTLLDPLWSRPSGEVLMSVLESLKQGED